MVILFNACVPVKSRKSFGMGIARPARERLPIGPTPAEAQWWAENSPANQYGYEVVGPTDCVLDAMARDAAELDRVCRGPVL